MDRCNFKTEIGPSSDDGNDDNLNLNDTSQLTSWQTMFQQLKDWQDLGHMKGFPPRLEKWMAAQRRQYKVYGIGEKEPVGIIKNRINKLNSLGFCWETTVVHDPAYEERKVNKKRYKLTSNTKNKMKHKNTASRIRRAPSIDSTHCSETDTSHHPQQNRSSKGKTKESHDSTGKMETTEDSSDEDSQVEDETSSSVGTNGDAGAGKGSSKQKGSNRNRLQFPGKLFDMICETAALNPAVIDWTPCGTGFWLIDEGAVSEVLLQYFRHNNLSSFIRQLNLYGFSKQLDGELKGAFKHPLFHRDCERGLLNSQLTRGGLRCKDFYRQNSRNHSSSEHENRPRRTNRRTSDRCSETICIHEGCMNYEDDQYEGLCAGHSEKTSSVESDGVPQRKRERPKSVERPTTQNLNKGRGRPKKISPEVSSNVSKKSPPLDLSIHRSDYKKPLTQNAHTYPTGHAVAHVPSDRVPEFGDGWITRTIKRRNQSGSKTSDTYFYSPQMQFKFRSKLEVYKFIECLNKCHGDEGLAIVRYKKMSRGRKT